ncbi:MAG: hypothetical protein WCR21_00340 [Bacteroidota bacterium]
MEKEKFYQIIFAGLFASMFITSCIKPHNIAPQADTETPSATDAVWATFVISDIEQQCAFLGENHRLDNFYIDVPGSYSQSNASGSITPTNDISAKAINYGFNLTHCYDGRLRDGSLFMFYGYDSDYDKYVIQKNENAKYLHDQGFVGRISLVDYKVDGWKIEIDPTKHGMNRAVVANIMQPNYVAAATPIHWRIVGDFIFRHPNDPSKDMSISVDMLKSLVNSADIGIYNQQAIGANIQWSNFVPVINSASLNPSAATRAALLAYTGTVSGVGANGEKFRMVIDVNHPLMRDFTCYADKIGAVAQANNGRGLVPVYQEFHPFSQGIASFTTGCKNNPDIHVDAVSDVYPRQIYFGNEEQPGLDMQCDNSGVLLIKGVSYRVDFKK